jgi:hypothetical protein
VVILVVGLLLPTASVMSFAQQPMSAQDLDLGARSTALQPEMSKVATSAVANSRLSGEIVISALDNEQHLPSVAYNWKHREYLVVWHNTWAIGTRDIRATRISEQGQVLNEFTVYEHPTKDSAQPSVAYDPVNDRYLVVWIFDAFGDGSDWDLYGRFIPWNGPSPSLTEFPIVTWSTSQWNPMAAYARAQEEFFVVWTNTYVTGTPPAYVSGKRIYANGSGFPSTGGDLTLSHTTENYINPDVSYNLARNEYLVVWEKVSTSRDIWAVRLTGSAAQLGGGPFGIAGWPDNEEKPAVAACEGADQYLVTWQSLVGSEYDLYARFIKGDGTPDSVHVISNLAGDQEEADVACNMSGRQYMVSWQEKIATYGISGRLVFPDKTMPSGFQIVPPGSAPGHTDPAVAGGYTNYLVAWEHQRSGTSYRDIHGRLITPHAVFVPLVIR